MERPGFQSTPPCGGDVQPGATDPGPNHFNPRPLAGATALFGGRSMVIGISIHAPLRGRLIWNFVTVLVYKISIHAPLRGRRTPGQMVDAGLPFQSTPPCGGDLMEVFAVLTSFISIHAPLRGRHIFRSPCPFSSLFQSTPPCGGDRCLCDNGTMVLKISIHAPLRGRPASGSSVASMTKFQSTPPCGGDSPRPPSLRGCL